MLYRSKIWNVFTFWCLQPDGARWMGDTWAYFNDDENYKSLQDLIKMLANTAAGGGNLLLNVGTKPDGTLPEQAIERLDKIWEWIKVNGEAIYNSEADEYS